MCQTRGKSYRPSQERTSPRLLIEYTWALFSTPLKKTRRKIRQEIRDFHRMGVWFLPRNLREKRPRWADTSDKMLAGNSIVRGRLVCFLLRWIRWQHRNMSLSRRYEVAAETEDVLFSFAIFLFPLNLSRMHPCLFSFVCSYCVLCCFVIPCRSGHCDAILSLPRKNMLALHIFFYSFA